MHIHTTYILTYIHLYIYTTYTHTHILITYTLIHIHIVMANFMCQLDWARGGPDIWSDIVLGMSVEVFLDEINF